MTFVERYGPWAVVTGASSGIGRAFVEELSNRGVNVVLVSRSEDALKALARKSSTGSRVHSLDLSEPGAPARLDTLTRDLDVGLFVASAGFGTSGAFLDADLDAETAMLDVNCRAVLELTHRFGRRFAARGRGGIILMGSIVGFQGVPGTAHYAATKAYIQSLAEALHQELKSYGVDVLSCAPGPVHSGFAARAGMKMGTALAPEELAAPTLEALGKRSTVVPGRLSKLLGTSLAFLPRPLRVAVMSRVMAGMTDHHGLAPS